MPPKRDPQQQLNTATQDSVVDEYEEHDAPPQAAAVATAAGQATYVLAGDTMREGTAAQARKQVRFANEDEEDKQHEEAAAAGQTTYVLAGDTMREGTAAQASQQATHSGAKKPVKMRKNPLYVPGGPESENDPTPQGERTPLLAEARSAEAAAPAERGTKASTPRVRNAIYQGGAAPLPPSRIQRVMAGFWLSLFTLLQMLSRNGASVITLSLMVFMIAERFFLHLREERIYLQADDDLNQFFEISALLASQALFLPLLVRGMQDVSFNLLNTNPNEDFCGPYSQITQPERFPLLLNRVIATLRALPQPADPACGGAPGFEFFRNQTDLPETVNGLALANGHEVALANGITSILALSLLFIGIALYRNPEAADAQERVFTGLAKLLGITLEKLLQLSRQLLLDPPSWLLSKCAPETMRHLKVWLESVYVRTVTAGSNKAGANAISAALATGQHPEPLRRMKPPFYVQAGILNTLSHRDTAGRVHNDGEFLATLIRKREYLLNRAAKATLPASTLPVVTSQFTEATAFQHIDASPYDRLLATMRGENPKHHRPNPHSTHTSVESALQGRIDNIAAGLSADDASAATYIEALRQQALHTLNAYERQRVMELIVKYLTHTWARKPLVSNKTAERGEQITRFHAFMEADFPVLLAILMTKEWKTTLAYLVPSRSERTGLLILSKLGIQPAWLKYLQALPFNAKFVPRGDLQQQNMLDIVETLGFLYTGQAFVAPQQRARMPSPQPLTRDHHPYEEIHDPYAALGQNTGLGSQAIQEIVSAVATAAGDNQQAADDAVYEVLQAVSMRRSRPRQPLPGEMPDENVYEVTPPQVLLQESPYETLQTVRKQQVITVTFDPDGKAIVTQQHEGYGSRQLTSTPRADSADAEFDIGHGDRLVICSPQLAPRLDDEAADDDGETIRPAAIPAVPAVARRDQARLESPTLESETILLNSRPHMQRDDQGSMKTARLCLKLFSANNTCTAKILANSLPSDNMSIKLKRQRGVNASCYQNETFDALYQTLADIYQHAQHYNNQLTDVHWILLVKFSAYLAQQEPAIKIQGAIDAITDYELLFQGSPRKDVLDKFITNQLIPIKQEIIALLFQANIREEFRSTAITLLEHCMKHDNKCAYGRALRTSIAAIRQAGFHAPTTGRMPAAEAAVPANTDGGAEAESSQRAQKPAPPPITPKPKQPRPGSGTPES